MAASVEHVQGRPAPALRRWVGGYTGYRERGLAPALHRGLPSPCLTLIVTLDEPVVIAAHPDPGQAPSRHRVLLGGLHTAPALVAHAGSQDGVQVALHPLGARALLGLPAGELAGLDLEAAEVVGPVADELHERVAAAGTWQERFAALDDVLLRVADPDAQVPPEVARAWHRLVASGGQVRAAQLAEETGWSGRHLAERFGVEVGLAPKAAARVARFDRARRLLAAGGARSLADVAADCGYADQAHLAREFNALAGCPPSRWRAEELRNVQAAPSPAPAGSRA